MRRAVRLLATSGIALVAGVAGIPPISRSVSAVRIAERAFDASDCIESGFRASRNFYRSAVARRFKKAGLLSDLPTSWRKSDCDRSNIAKPRLDFEEIGGAS
jgi:hypothetical protein